jgi:hypothetical protein
MDKLDKYDSTPGLIDIEGYIFKEWTYEEKLEIEDLANVANNRYLKPSQWENEVYKILFVKFCISWPCEKWKTPVECTEEAKSFLYRMQAKLCRRLVLRVLGRIDTLDSERLKNWQTGLSSGGSAQ